MSPQPDSDPIIQFRNVSYQIRDAKGQTAKLRDGVRFTVLRGDTVVMLGRSGAGKTRAFKLLNRPLDPPEGDVLVEGKSTRDWNPIALRRHIGYVIQETG